MSYLPDRKLTIMEKKFLEANRDDAAGVPWPRYKDPNRDPNAFRTINFFFYGTLMDPDFLARVLGRTELPRGTPARIFGYKLMLWGPYPALIDTRDHFVDGMAYQIESQEEVDRLCRYETDHYEIKYVLIRMQDGTGREMIGKSFGWNRDHQELREGVFDLKDFQQRQRETSGHSS